MAKEDSTIHEVFQKLEVSTPKGTESSASIGNKEQEPRNGSGNNSNQNIGNWLWERAARSRGLVSPADRTIDRYCKIVDNLQEDNSIFM